MFYFISLILQHFRKTGRSWNMFEVFIISFQFANIRKIKCNGDERYLYRSQEKLLPNTLLGSFWGVHTLGFTGIAVQFKRFCVTSEGVCRVSVMKVTILANQLDNDHLFQENSINSREYKCSCMSPQKVIHKNSNIIARMFSW